MLSWKKWLIIVGVVLVIGLLLFLSWPRPPEPIDTQALISEATAKLEKDYKKRLADKDIAIKDLKGKLSISEAKYTTLMVRYQELQKEKENVKPPENLADMVRGYTALGYPPRLDCNCPGAICFDTGYGQSNASSSGASPNN